MARRAPRKTKVTAEVVDRDLGFKKLVDVLGTAVKGSSVKVGVLGAQASQKEGGGGGGLTMVELAAIHEFGAPEANIPERSFIRSTFDARRQVYQDLAGKGLKAMVEGRVRDVRQILGPIGMLMVSDVRARVRAGLSPSLSPVTLARKAARTRPGSTGSPLPLIDTGRLLQSLTHEVTVGPNDPSLKK